MGMNISLLSDVLWVNVYSYVPGCGTNPHTHPGYYHLIYCVDGTSKVTLNGQPYTLSTDYFMIAKPGEEHCVCILEKDADPVDFLEIKFSVFSQAIAKALNRISLVQKATPFSKELIKKIMDVSLGNSGKSGIEARRYYISTFLYVLCEDVLVLNDTNNSGSYLHGIDTSSFAKATLETVKYLEANFCNEITLDTISKKVGYNKNYISTVVKRDLSISVNEFLMLLRIQKATELLIYSDESLSRIYELTGFKSNNHFTRVFKKIVGIPPSQYRRSFPEGVDVTNVQDTSHPVWIKHRFPIPEEHIPMAENEEANSQ